MKTEAAILYELGKPLVVEELTLPELKHGQVLVKIAFSGICHSQLLEIRGKRGEDRYLPHTLGHEGSGIVEAVGPGVTHVKPGDHVVLSWIKGPGEDVPSCSYRKGDVLINSGAITTFNEYSIISENRITPITKEMSFDKAALLGCAIPTGVGSVLNTAKVRPGSSIAIFGVGGIGLCAVLAADLMNCSKIIAIDIYNHKLQLAEELGATHVINANKDDPVSTIMDLTADIGVDYAIEAAGTKETMEKAFLSVRYNGGLLVIAGNLAQKQYISIDPFDLIKGKRIVGTWGGETRPERDIPFYVNTYLSGKLKLEKLITHRYKLDDINKAFEDLENGKVGRALIQFYDNYTYFQ